jgi:hypothetical protein
MLVCAGGGGGGCHCKSFLSSSAVLHVIPIRYCTLNHNVESLETESRKKRILRHLLAR